MSLVGYRAKNHPQQVGVHGPRDVVDDRGTDPALFAELSQRFFGFTVDVAASEFNAKCERFYTKETDGLAHSWAGERVWCNPPYSDISAWVQKAHREAELAAIIVMLLPANRTEQGWWQDYIEPFRDQPDGLMNVQFLRGRPRFVRVGTTAIGPNERPPFGCCLVVWEQDRSVGEIE